MGLPWLAGFVSLGDLTCFLFPCGVKVMDGATMEARTFLTPPRILIPKLAASREGWKKKAGERKRRLKAAKIRIRDLEVSRRNWQERALAAERLLAERNRDLAAKDAELAAARRDAEQLRDALKKK
jgi:hypothetical protein